MSVLRFFRKQYKEDSENYKNSGIFLMGLFLLFIFIGVKTFSSLIICGLPIVTAPYFYNKLKEKEFENNKILKIMIPFYSLLVILFIEVQIFGVPKFKFMPYIFDNIILLSLIITLVVLIIEKSKVLKINRKYFYIFLCILWTIVYLFPLYIKFV